MGKLYEISTEGTEVALSAATVKTVLEVQTGANLRAKIVAFGIYFDGIDPAAAPVQVAFARKSVDGTGTAVTEREWDPDESGTVQFAGIKDNSAEGTITHSFQPREVHPQQGVEIWYPLGREIPLGISLAIGLRATAPAAVNCEAWILVEE